MTALRRPSPVIQRMLDEHRTWLYSGGRDGIRIDLVLRDDDHGLPQEMSDWRYLDLAGVDLSLARLIGVQASGSRLKGAVLIHADLQVAEFRGSDMRGAQAPGSLVAGADFTDAQTDQHTNFEGAYDCRFAQRLVLLHPPGSSRLSIPATRRRWTESDNQTWERVGWRLWRNQKGLEAPPPELQIELL